VNDAAYKNAISYTTSTTTTTTTTTKTKTKTTTTTTTTTTTRKNNKNRAAPFTTPFQIYRYTQNVLFIEYLSRQFFAHAHEAHKPQCGN